MAFLFQKFQEAVKVLAKSRTFARDPRHFQFDADVNRLFLYTSYYRMGKNADENDAEEIINLASKASVNDQQKQVQENVHCQIKNMSTLMDEILLTDVNTITGCSSSSNTPTIPKRTGLSFAVGKGVISTNQQVVPATRPLTRLELSQSLKDRIGYTVDIRPSQITHEEAGQGLFLNGEADVGSVVAIYPGVIYSPAYYRNIPGYPRIDACNPYLITRYDGIIINAQPWGTGGESREVWNGFYEPDYKSQTLEDTGNRSDRIWRMLSNPIDSGNTQKNGEILELRNPLASAHFANHPPKGIEPNVMVCPYDFPISENDLRSYIPNLVFGNEENFRMKRFGTFWFKSGSSHGDEGDTPLIKTLVLVATRSLTNEELFLNYRLSNQKRRPSWYTPVDVEEDKRRWS